jgi:aspartate aminotransferase
MSHIALADRMNTLQESATLALNARAKQLAADGKAIYNLTAGELAAETPAYVQKAVAQTLGQNKYTPVAGLPVLREAIAANARDFYQLDWIESHNIVVTAGAKPALYATFLALINPGDEVIVPTPAWVSYNHLIELAGGVVVEVPLTDAFDLDAEAIRHKLSTRTKAILLNSPHNPTGAVFSSEALDATADVLESTNVTVIADDIYAKLVYDASFSLVPSHHFKNIVIINGFSKSQALTGWRIGYVIAAPEIAGAITNLLSHTMGNAAVPSQYAALAALHEGDVPPAATLQTLQDHRKLVAEKLAPTPGLSYCQPGGAFYVFLDLRDITNDSAAWCERLLIDAGVALVPGEAFSAPGFARLSFVTDTQTLVTALELIDQFVTREILT